MRENQIIVFWRTASEFNNKGFEIEHSFNGNFWRNIGFVKGKGTTFEQQSYSFLHENPEQNINYYRLKQLDFDGAFEYSDIISVDLTNFQSLTNLKIIPNPVQAGEITLYIPNPDFESGQIEIFNATGQLVLSQKIFHSNTITDVRSLSKGVYWVNVNTDGRRWQKKVLIQ